MNASKVLNKKSASKDELRKALAAALGLPCPAWANKPPTVHARCRQIFTDYYEQQSGIEYIWTAKDGGCINHIIKKIYAISKQTEEDEIVKAFMYLLTNLPEWYKVHGLSLCVINGKFSEIIAAIKNGGKQGQLTTASVLDAAGKMGE